MKLPYIPGIIKLYKKVMSSKDKNLKQTKALQEKYLKFCKVNLLNDKKIHSFCNNAEKEINHDYEDLYKNTDRKNLICGCLNKYSKQKN